MADIAFLVLSHHTPATQCLLQLLDERFAIVIHVDGKTDLDATPLHLPPHAMFTEERFPIFWGGFNMIRATREMVRVARKAHPELRRYVLISGDALPVVAVDKLCEFLLDPAIEFMTLIPVPNDPALRHMTHEEALKRHNWLQPWRFQNFALWDHVVTCPRDGGRTAMLLGIDDEKATALRSDIHYKVTQPLLKRIPPRPALFRQFYFGSQWWGLSNTAIDLIYEDMFDPEIESFFEFMEIPDEHYFQCLIGRHKGFLEGIGKTFKWHLMYVDHDDPIRARFGDDALEAHRFFDCHTKTGHIFARKFNPARAEPVRDAISDLSYFSRLMP